MKIFILAQMTSGAAAGVKQEHVRLIESSPVGQALGIVLPIILVVGFVIVFGIRATDLELPRPIHRIIVRFFVLFLISYLLWFAHFLGGTPFLFPIEIEFGFVLAMGSALILGLYWFEGKEEIKKDFNPEEDTYCKQCGAVILKIAAKCPKCGADNG